MAESTHASLCPNVTPLMEKMICLKEKNLSWKVFSQAFCNIQFHILRKAMPQSMGDAGASSCWWWWWGRLSKMRAPRGPRKKKAKKHWCQGKQGKKERGPWVHSSFWRLFRMLRTWRQGHSEYLDDGEKLEEIPLLVLDGSSDKD